MNILEIEILKKAIKNIFKDRINFISERNRIIESMVEKTTYLRRQENKAKSFVYDMFQNKEITKEEKEKKLNNIYNEFIIKEKNLNNELDILFEEYKKKYDKPVILNNFINEIKKFNKNDFAYSEKLSYIYKDNKDNKFSIIFLFGKEKKTNSSLVLSVEDNNGNFIQMNIQVGLNKEIQVEVIYIKYKDNKFLLANYDDEEANIKKDNAILPTIKEKNLLELDQPEFNDILLMLYDNNLNLVNIPLYKTFKEGLKSFYIEIEKNINLTNKNKND